MKPLVVALLVLLPCHHVQAQPRQERVDLYYVIVDHQTVRIDIYDAKSRRTGYGRSTDRSTDLYDVHSRRTGSAGTPNTTKR